MWLEVLLSLGCLMIFSVSQWMVLEHTAPFFRDFDTKTKHAWIGRVTATVFETAVILFAAVNGYQTVWGAALLIAYLIHDMGHTILYDPKLENFVHHIISFVLTILQKTLMSPDQAEATRRAMFTLESTGPVLHISWAMNKAGYANHPAFKYVAGFSVVFFGIMRLLAFPWVMYTSMNTATASVFSPLLGLNVYWFYKLVQLVIRVLDKNAGTDLPL
jgi:hypothetical protein